MIRYLTWSSGVTQRTDAETAAALEEVNRQLELEIGEPVTIVVVQGSYSGSSKSGGTHLGEGVVDISVNGWSDRLADLCVLWLRKVGFAAWLRTTAQGFDPHIHAVRKDATRASWEAKAQVIAYDKGRSGLMSNQPDDGPRVTPVTWTAYKKENPLMWTPKDFINSDEIPAPDDRADQANSKWKFGSYVKETYQTLRQILGVLQEIRDALKARP